MNSANCTMLVSSCDKNEDIWLPFFMCLEKYWPEMAWNIVLNTESKSFTYKDYPIKSYKFFENEPDDWSKRLKLNLEKINTKYVFFILDDFFITEKVNHNFISMAYEYMENDSDISVFSFHPVKDKLNIKSQKYSGFEKRPNKGGEYKLNCQAAIWRKDRLIRMLRNGETPWDFEIYGSIRISYFTDKFYVLSENLSKPIEYNMRKNGTGLVRGKWSRSVVVPLFKELGINIDFTKRGFISEDYFDTDNRTLIQKIQTKFKKLKAHIWSYYSVLAGFNITKSE